MKKHTGETIIGIMLALIIIASILKPEYKIEKHKIENVIDKPELFNKEEPLTLIEENPTSTRNDLISNIDCNYDPNRAINNVTFDLYNPLKEQYYLDDYPDFESNSRELKVIWNNIRIRNLSCRNNDKLYATTGLPNSTLHCMIKPGKEWYWKTDIRPPLRPNELKIFTSEGSQKIKVYCTEDKIKYRNFQE